MDETQDISVISRHSALSMISLTGRTAFLQIVAFIATLFLTVFLSPPVFGIFFIVSGIVAFLNYFSDVGLAAALIQKKEPITDSDLRTTFTIQQILVLALVFISLGISDQLVKFYGFDSEGQLLFKALVFAFFLSSLKTIPSIILERKLEFHKLVIPQVIETLVFYTSAVLFAYLGWGVRSFTIAVLIRGLSGLVAIYFIQPWHPSLGIEKTVVRRLLNFGLPFQLNSFLALVKDDLFTVLLGKILTFTEVGYIGWAKKWAEVPLRLLMDNIIRVTFPAYARLQHDREALSRGIEKALFFLLSFIGPLVLEMIFIMEPFISLIPRYAKWYPALFSFYLFALSTIFSSISSPLLNALNAIGKIRITLQLMILWTILTWSFVPILIFIYGFNGVATGMFLISLSVVYVIRKTQEILPFSLSHSILSALIYITGLFFYLLMVGSLMREANAYARILWYLLGMFIYVIILYWRARTEVHSLIRMIKYAQR